MGLAGPSKKRKISHDPNNTTWTRSEGFGHRILSSQGWTPGTILGPDPNNPHHTSASQVGVKVVLKDDNLGLGCKLSQEDTCTGLGDLQNLLGRLNGKSVEVVRQEEDTRLKLYASSRFGMVFVRGETLESTWVTGALKGTKIVEEEDSEDTSDSTNDQSDRKSKRDRKKERKRKESSGSEAERQSADDDDEKDSSSVEDSTSKAKAKSKSKSSEKAARKAEKVLRKAEKLAKKERKELKRLRKDEKKRLKAEKKAMTSIIASKVSTTPSSTASTPPIMPSGEIEVPLGKVKLSKSLPNSLPTSGTSTPIHTTGRQALRARWIAQKKMAVMDAKALNEILMIKT